MVQALVTALLICSQIAICVFQYWVNVAVTQSDQDAF